MRRRRPSILGGAVRGRRPRGAIDRPARVRSRPRLPRRRRFQGGGDLPTGVRPLRRDGERASDGARRATGSVRRRAYRVARRERQLERRADIPVGEHRLPAPCAHHGPCARRADSASGEGDRGARRERRGARANVAAPAETASPPLGGSVTVAKPSTAAAPSPTEATTSVAAAGPRRPPVRGR